MPITLDELKKLQTKYRIPKISVDFFSNTYNRVDSKQLDTARYLLVSCTENGVFKSMASAYKARLRLEKPDKNVVLNDCKIVEDGTILVELTEQILAVKGKAVADVSFTIPKQVGSTEMETYSTKNFIIEISETACDLNKVISSYEFNTLVKLIEEEEKRIQDLKNLDKTLTDNEAVRQSDEEIRKSNEADRQKSENTRSTNENARKSNESVRQSQESDRNSAESIRVTNEISRGSEESKRKSQENNRKSNENLRQSAESVRVSSESTRNTNETARQNTESVRNTNENNRKSNENSRQNAESVRVSNENIRKSNETERQSSENIRNTNEVTRQNQESNRELNTANALSEVNIATQNCMDATDDLQNKLNTHHFVLTEDKGVANGVATLDSNVKIPSVQLPTATSSVYGAVKNGTNINNTGGVLSVNTASLAQSGVVQLMNSISSASTTAAAVPASVKSALDTAKLYADTKVNQLINGAPETLNTIKEVADAITSNKSTIDALNAAIGTKANKTDFNTHIGNGVMHITSGERTAWNNKVDKVSGKVLSTNDYTTAEKNKLAGISAGANAYVHPSAHPASMITQDAAHRFVTDTEKTVWNGKQDKLTVDSALSSASTNPVQNKAVNAALAGKAPASHTHSYAGSASAGGAANSANALNAVLITANTDLNSVTTPGFYYCPGNVTAATFKNSPTSYAFFMIVGKHAGVYQEVIEYLTSGQKRFIRNYYDKAWGSWHHVYTSAEPQTAVSGNAGTATALKTARTINGTAFNGTGNITTANWGTARTLTIGNTGKSVNGSGNAAWTLAEIGAAPVSHTHNYAGSSSAGGAAATALACTGNAATATKATQDSAGQQINSTYIKGLSANGKTITYTKGNGVTGSITTQDTVYNPFSGATVSATGRSGLVPAPGAGKQGQFLRGDGTWQTPADTNTWRGIQNNLTSTSTTDSLAAAQGKVLNDKIAQLNTNFANQKNTINNSIGGYRAYAGNIAPGAFSGGVINFTEKFNELPAVVATIDHYYTDCLNVTVYNLSKASVTWRVYNRSSSQCENVYVNLIFIDFTKL